MLLDSELEQGSAGEFTKHLGQACIKTQFSVLVSQTSLHQSFFVWLCLLHIDFSIYYDYFDP